MLDPIDYTYKPEEHGSYREWLVTMAMYTLKILEVYKDEKEHINWHHEPEELYSVETIKKTLLKETQEISEPLLVGSGALWLYLKSINQKPGFFPNDFDVIVNRLSKTDRYSKFGFAINDKTISTGNESMHIQLIRKPKSKVVDDFDIGVAKVIYDIRNDNFNLTDPKVLEQARNGVSSYTYQEFNIFIGLDKQKHLTQDAISRILKYTTRGFMIDGFVADDKTLRSSIELIKQIRTDSYNNRVGEFTSYYDVTENSPNYDLELATKIALIKMWEFDGDKTIILPDMDSDDNTVHKQIYPGPPMRRPAYRAFANSIETGIVDYSNAALKQFDPSATFDHDFRYLSVNTSLDHMIMVKTGMDFEMIKHEMTTDLYIDKFEAYKFTSDLPVFINIRESKAKISAYMMELSSDATATNASDYELDPKDLLVDTTLYFIKDLDKVVETVDKPYPLMIGTSMLFHYDNKPFNHKLGEAVIFALLEFITPWMDKYGGVATGSAITNSILPVIRRFIPNDLDIYIPVDPTRKDYNPDHELLSMLGYTLDFISADMPRHDYVVDSNITYVHRIKEIALFNRSFRLQVIMVNIPVIDAIKRFDLDFNKAFWTKSTGVNTELAGDSISTMSSYYKPEVWNLTKTLRLNEKTVKRLRKYIKRGFRIYHKQSGELMTETNVSMFWDAP